jgi:hypothetical protein
MATINDPSVAANIARVGAVDTSADQNAQHTSCRPTAYGSLGHYKWGRSTGILPAGLAAGSEIFQYRWSHASVLSVIGKIQVSACVTTTMFAAGVPLEIELVKSTAWSVAGTGGTANALSGMCKARESMANSSLLSGDMRIATTAALGAGTKTLQTEPMASLVAPGPITGSLNGMIIAPGTVLWESNQADGVHPLVLGGFGGGALSHGFSIISRAVPGTGTWRFSIYIQWAEVAAF